MAALRARRRAQRADAITLGSGPNTCTAFLFSLTQRALKAFQHMSSNRGGAWAQLALVYDTLVFLDRSTAPEIRARVLASLIQFLAAVARFTRLSDLSPTQHAETRVKLARYIQSELGSGAKRPRYSSYPIGHVIALGRRRRRAPCAQCGNPVFISEARLIVMDTRPFARCIVLCQQGLH